MDAEVRLTLLDGTVVSLYGQVVTPPVSLQFRLANRRVFSVPLNSHGDTPVHTICTVTGEVQETGV